EAAGGDGVEESVVGRAGGGAFRVVRRARARTERAGRGAGVLAGVRAGPAVPALDAGRLHGTPAAAVPRALRFLPRAASRLQAVTRLPAKPVQTRAGRRDRASSQISTHSTSGPAPATQGSHDDPGIAAAGGGSNTCGR